MEIDKIKITDIKPAEYNPRQITSEELQKLTNSISEFGLVDPIIINLKNNRIIGGHQRYEVLLNQYMLDNNFYAELNLIKMGDIGWIFTETDLKLKDEDHEKALNLALNKISGEWDFEKLGEVLDELEINGFDITLTGFDGLDDIYLDMEEEETSNDNDYEVEEDDYEIEEELQVTVKTGDLYQLGKHRLLCGDSTNKQDVLKLIGKAGKVDITFTSPPYNTQQEMKDNPLSNDGGYGLNNYYTINDGLNGNVYKHYRDDLNNEDYSQLLIKSAKNGLEFSDDILFNIGILKGSKIGVINLLNELQDNLLDILVWNKNNAMPLGLETQKKMVSHICELIFCFNKQGNRSFTHAQWDKGTKTNRIDSSNASDNKEAKNHKATFPIDFAGQIVKDFSSTSVLDLFGGSGTTLIACEQLNRTCYMMEIDPYYCQIIINRWEEYTGEKAELIEE